MYTQLKYSYKKSREQFMQQLKIIRQQLKQKIENIDGVYEEGRNVVSMRENHSSFTYRDQRKIPSYPDLNSHVAPVLKGYLEQADQQPRQISVYQHNHNPESQRNASRQKKEQMSSYRKLKINRLQSLPSKFKSARLLESYQSSFQPFFLKMPKSRQNRLNSQLLSALAHLQEHNKVFSQLDKHLSLCLLRIGFYHELNPHDILYGINYDKSSIYIILSGVICLMNPNIGLKKMLFTGDTLGEQMLFGSEPIRYHLEVAKTMKKAYILQIKTADYLALSEQLSKLKNRKAFAELEQILRDGFTQKNIARNQHLLNRKIRMRTNN